MNKQSIIVNIIIVFILGIILAKPATSTRVFAQAEENPWTEPINLSNSGSATNPGIVVDSNGITHVVWQDVFSGYLYSRQEDGYWTEPVIVEFPFTEVIPYLVSDSSGYIHAFWIDGQDGSLNYSRVTSTDVGVSNGWKSTISLSDSVVDFSVSIIDPSHIHLAFIRNEEDETQSGGVYYMGSMDSGATWNPQIAIDQSKYLRSATKENSNVQIASTLVGDTENVFVVWDNRSLERIFLSKSYDGGLNWTTPLEVDGPGINTITISPYNIMIDVSGKQILLVWQAGLQSGFACTQHYQWSDDLGATWSDFHVMLDQFVGCAQENKLFPLSGGTRLLQTVFDDEVYLLAWDGTAWSEPQPQSNLYSFLDPFTENTVNFRCRQYAVQDGDRLNVVGCDTIGDSDIWWTTRTLDDISSWFAPPSAWSQPIKIAESKYEVSTPVVIMDNEGKPFVFWIQEEQTSRGAVQRAIYAASSEIDGWSQPARIIKSPDNYVQHMSLASDAGGRIFLAWEGGRSGELYFSTANIQNAISPLEWIEPVELPVTQGFGRSPSIQVSQVGTIYIAYAVSLNEGRGIYLLTSDDGGMTWSTPKLVFNAGDAGWQMVDSPQLALGNDMLHLLWTQNTIVGNGGTIGLYYANSKDSGQTWTAPSQVVAQPIWASQIQASSDQVAHRLWMDLHAQGSTNLYHEASFDNGITWGPTTNLTKFGEVPGPFYLVSQDDITHLLQIVNETGGKSVMSNLVWQKDHWISNVDLHIDGTIQGVYSISADIDPEGFLGAVLIAQKPEESDIETSAGYQLLYLKQLDSAEGETNPSTARATPTPNETIVALQTQDIASTVASTVQTQGTAPLEPQITPGSTTTPTELTPATQLTPIPATDVSNPVPTMNNTENPGEPTSTMNVFILAGMIAFLVVGTGIVISLFSTRR